MKKRNVLAFMLCVCERVLVGAEGDGQRNGD